MSATNEHQRVRTVILGAAGRDFHDFNLLYRDDPFTDKVGFAHRRRADMHRLVRRTDVKRVGIGIGIDRDSANAQAAGRADDTAGDFAAIGDEEGFDHG